MPPATQLKRHVPSINKNTTLRTAYHALVGLDHVFDGDGQRVLGCHHVDHLAQHVLELDGLLSLVHFCRINTQENKIRIHRPNNAGGKLNTYQTGNAHNLIFVEVLHFFRT
jgi:hypothetical protein